MTTGTKAIMAAAGSGGSVGDVKYPIQTKSDNSGSDKVFLHAVDTEGNIGWTKEIGSSLSSSDPLYYFPTDGRGDLCWYCEVGNVWWVMASSSQRVWAIDTETGDCSYYDSGDLPNFTSGTYGPTYALSAPVYFNSSGGTDTLGWLQHLNYTGTTSGNRFQGYTFTNDRTTTPTVFGDFASMTYGNTALYNGGAMVNYDYNSTSGFHNWKEYATGEVYIAWQSGSTASSYNVKIQSAAIDQDTPVGVSNVSNLFGPTSNYSRGTAVRICSGLSMQKFFDENWASYNGETSMAAVSGDTGDSMGITSSNVSSQKPPAPTITSPLDYGTMLTVATAGNLTFDYEQQASVTSDGVKGMWGFIRLYNVGYGSVAYNLGYVETGTSWSSGQSMAYASGGDNTDYSDVCYRATAHIYTGTPTNNYELPSINMRRINDNGYVGMWCPNFATSNQRWEIRVLDATNGQVGSTIEFDFPVEHANKAHKYCNLREDAVWTKLYSGSNVS